MLTMQLFAALPEGARGETKAEYEEYKAEHRRTVRNSEVVKLEVAKQLADKARQKALEEQALASARLQEDEEEEEEEQGAVGGIPSDKDVGTWQDESSSEEEEGGYIDGNSSEEDTISEGNISEEGLQGGETPNTRAAAAAMALPAAHQQATCRHGLVAGN